MTDIRRSVMLSRTTLVLLAVAALACAPQQSESGRTAPAPATVQVDNQAFLDVNVYALRSGQRIRLGTVTGLSTRTFVIPRTLVGGALVRFQADFIGSGRAPVSEEMVIWAGDSVELTIPAA